MKIFTYPVHAVVLAAAKAINNLLIESKSRSVLLMLSGGSSLQLLPHLQNLHHQMTITVLDERLSTDPKINNFTQIAKTKFYNEAQSAGCKFIPTIFKPTDDIDDFTWYFETELKSWRRNNPNGMVIITQGIGIDGHTAGIMPFPEDPQLFTELFDSKQWVIGYDTGEMSKYQERMTVTITFLKQVVDHSIVFAVGEEKKEILTQLQSKQANIASLPAMVVWEMKDVKLFTDN